MTPQIIKKTDVVSSAKNGRLLRRMLIKRLLPAIKFILLLIPILLLRVIYLDSDAYPRLSWSSALFTDEGFYIHNARNLVLFGHERTDEFNNALIMPLLHFAQVILFRCVGVGAVQARSLSVVLSLLNLLLFFAALRRAFGARIAWLGVLLLGLDPVFVLYNRLALMDTPACLPLCAAFYAWVRGGERERSKGLDIWLFLSGLCLAIAYSVRGLAFIATAAPLLILMVSAVESFRSNIAVAKTSEGLTLQRSLNQRLRISFAPLASFAAGMVFVFSIYLILWYFPHRTELAFLNKYYVQEQLLPHSFYRLQRNVVQAFLHPYRGVFPYLFKHSPLLLLLGGLTIGCSLFDRVKQLARDRNSKDKLSSLLSMQSAPFSSATSSWGQYFLMGWVLIFLIFVCIVDYAPSRYYILFYPALAALAAIGLDRVANMRISIPNWLSTTSPHTSHRSLVSSQVIALVLCLWGSFNLYWYTDWISNMTYRQRDADAWLATHLPPDSVLIGATAPGLCLNNHFRCVNMIDHLCNYNRPVERFAPSPRYIAILDQEAYYIENLKKKQSKYKEALSKVSQQDKKTRAVKLAWANRWRENWWTVHYAEIVKPERRLHAFPKLIRPFFTIGIYAVPFDFDYISSYYEKMAGVRKEF